MSEQKLSQQQQAASQGASGGSRYYKVDDNYDKSVYENTPGNWVRIIVSLLVFWLFQALHWWAVFELGIFDAWIQTLYQIVIFVVTLIVGTGMLISGKFANEKKRYHTFLMERISEKKASKEEDEIRVAQEEAYEKRLQSKNQTAA